MAFYLKLHTKVMWLHTISPKKGKERERERERERDEDSATLFLMAQGIVR